MIIRCEFEKYDGENTVKCKHESTHTISTLCCGQVTFICRRCLDLLETLNFWRCNGCNNSQPAPFFINKRTIPYVSKWAKT